jgi:hypothetical protein
MYRGELLCPAQPRHLPTPTTTRPRTITTHNMMSPSPITDHHKTITHHHLATITRPPHHDKWRRRLGAALDVRSSRWKRGNPSPTRQKQPQCPSVPIQWFISFMVKMFCGITWSLLRFISLICSQFLPKSRYCQ